MDNNAKLKLIINYLDKSSEINLDNNDSFDQAKTNIAKQLDISDKDKDNIFVKFFDIKYEKLSSQENCQLKLELFNYENSKEMVELKKEIESFNKELESINKQYEENIKQIKKNYEFFKENIIKQNNDNYNLIKDEISGVILNNKREHENIDNNLYVEKNKEILKLISQIKNEIKEIKENKNNNNNNDKNEININEINEINKINEINEKNEIINMEDNINITFYGTFEDFKKTYKINDLGISEEIINRTFINNKRDFFDTMSELIKKSYENLEKSKKN